MEHDRQELFPICGKYANYLSCSELDETIDTTLVSALLRSSQ